MEVDYSETCDKKMPEAKTFAAKGKLNEAFEMFALEKQTRSGADTHSTGRVLVTIVQLCFEAKEWNQLNEKIIDLVKKRAQLKQMVSECCTFLDKTPDKPTMMKLINTLRTFTKGKIYMENERSRLTHCLAMIHEKDGDVTEAAKIMQELQVETYGSMERKEKVEMILEQMGLCLAVQDFFSAQIISKKISTRFFEDAKYADMKLKFYGYMIEGHHEGDYLDICKNYRQVHETSTIQEDAVKKIQTQMKVILYVVLANYNNETLFTGFRERS